MRDSEFSNDNKVDGRGDPVTKRGEQEQERRHKEYIDWCNSQLGRKKTDYNGNPIYED